MRCSRQKKRLSLIHIYAETAEEDAAEDTGQAANDALPLEDGSAETAGAAADVWFSEESILEWPASGAVLINYSMDKTVYFSTLAQYKYNPAMIISGADVYQRQAVKEAIIDDWIATQNQYKKDDPKIVYLSLIHIL